MKIKMQNAIICSVSFLACILIAGSALAGRWEYKERIDKMTEKLAATAQIINVNEKTALAAWCDEEGVQVGFFVPVTPQRGSDSTVEGSYRFWGKSGTIAINYFYLSQEKTILFAKQDVDEIVRLLAVNDEIMLRIHDYKGYHQTYKFSLAGSKAALGKLECVSFD